MSPEPITSGWTTSAAAGCKPSSTDPRSGFAFRWSVSPPQPLRRPGQATSQTRQPLLKYSRAEPSGTRLRIAADKNLPKCTCSPRIRLIKPPNGRPCTLHSAQVHLAPPAVGECAYYRFGSVPEVEVSFFIFAYASCRQETRHPPASRIAYRSNTAKTES